MNKSSYTYRSIFARILLCLTLVLSVAPIAAEAASPASSQLQTFTVDELKAAATNGGRDDESMRFLTGIFGDDFVNKTWTSAGAPSGLLGKILVIVNSIIFVLVAASLGGGALMLITKSADAGEALGRDHDRVWMPIRAIVAVVGSVPIFGGFSLMQAAMMTATVAGIGAANITSSLAVQVTTEYTALTPSSAVSSSVPNVTSDLQLATRSILLSELCDRAHVLWLNRLGEKLPPAPTRAVSGRTVVYDYGECGSIVVSPRAGADLRTNSSIGFRINSVDYKAISNAVFASSVAYVDSVRENSGVLATKWADEAAKIIYEGTDGMPVGGYKQVLVGILETLDALETQAKIASEQALIDAAKSSGGAIDGSVATDLNKQGWLALGSYYQTFAEVSNAIADAQKATRVSYAQGPIFASLNESAQEWGGMSRVLRQAAIEIMGATQSVQTSGAADQLNAWITKYMPASWTSTMTSTVDRVANAATSTVNAFRAPSQNISIGQAITMFISKSVIGLENSGGAGLVNPLIASKNLGDFLIVTGETLLALNYGASKIGLSEDKGSSKGFLSSLGGGIANTVLSVIPGAGLLRDGLAFLSGLAWPVIGMGMFLAIYIPLLFWLTWVSALLSWLTGVLEAVVYAQMSTLSHASVEGQGYVPSGSPAARFYMYLLNMLLRPTIIVVAFFAGSAAMTYVGSFALNSFAVAMSSAQGNSVTGIASVFGYVAVLCVVIFGLVQTCANMLITLPDQLLGWLGAHGTSHNQALAGAAVAGSLQRLRGPMPKAKPTGPAGPGEGGPNI